MWKNVDEITSHNQAAGRPTEHDPFEAINTMVVEVEGLTLEGEQVVLFTCCESARLKREDVIAWFELKSTDGGPSLYRVRLRKGAPVIAQRAAVVSREPTVCHRCGRGWTGLPDPRNYPQRQDGPQHHGPQHHHGHRHHDRGHEQHGAHSHGHANSEDYPGKPRENERRER